MGIFLRIQVVQWDYYLIPTLGSPTSGSFWKSDLPGDGTMLSVERCTCTYHLWVWWVLQAWILVSSRPSCRLGCWCCSLCHPPVRLRPSPSAYRWHSPHNHAASTTSWQNVARDTAHLPSEIQPQTVMFTTCNLLNKIMPCNNLVWTSCERYCIPHTWNSTPDSAVT